MATIKYTGDPVRPDMRRLRTWLVDLVLAHLLVKGEASVAEVTIYASKYYNVNPELLEADVAAELEKLVLGGLAIKVNGRYKIRRDKVSDLTIERLRELGLIDKGQAGKLGLY